MIIQLILCHIADGQKTYTATLLKTDRSAWLTNKAPGYLARGGYQNTDRVTLSSCSAHVGFLRRYVEMVCQKTSVGRRFLPGFARFRLTIMATDQV